eukprot:940949-Prorocentrum_minimum.AAC.1
MYTNSVIRAHASVDMRELFASKNAEEWERREPVRQTAVRDVAEDPCERRPTEGRAERGVQCSMFNVQHPSRRRRV